MTTEQKKIFLVIHGHFYQPPRENPWTQRIPRQESAAPFHDWNERITSECYKPNTRSRVMNDQGQILSLENNFAHINFNIGPTLFAWLEEHAPDVYQKILAADALSCQQQGYGNAIAQAYNHIMLPLANTRDAATQILWGIREFRHRFGRAPESIWLPETGINDDTVNLLIEHGLKYVILSPTQAQRICHIGEDDWLDVSDNGIDVTQPYRLFKKETTAVASAKKSLPINDPHAPEVDADAKPGVRYSPDQYIDVFFYNGSLSSEISFSHLLQNPHLFAQKIQEAAARSSASRVLVHVATDGEIYGHHERHGDMSLAALLTNKLPSIQVEVTNYSRFLAICPPTMQVELKPGSEDGEGTSWSCSHGVGRWYRDCGCAVDSPAGWNQAWRTPLREAFDVLRDGVAELFEESGRAILRDPWAARNDYIEYMLDPTDETLAKFFERHAAHPLSEAEQSLALRLLEAQKYSMFTYTSCGWFFNDVSGLEPVQNMRYAARALQLVEGLASPDLETKMLNVLDNAVSNMPQYGTGKMMYLNYVKPDIFTPERAVNHLLLTTQLQQKAALGKASKHPLKKLAGRQEYPIHIYALRCQSVSSWKELGGQPATEEVSGETFEHDMIFSGVIEVKDTTTKQIWTLLFTTCHDANKQPISYLKQFQNANDAESFFAAIAQRGSDAQQEIIRVLEQHGLTQYTLTDLYHDDREHVFGHVLQEYAHSVEDHIETVYAKSVELLDSLTKASLQVPAALHASVEFALTYHAMIEMERLYSKEVGEYSPATLRAALEKMLHLSGAHCLTLDMGLLRSRLTEALRQYIDRLSRRFLDMQQRGRDSFDFNARESFLVLLRDTLNLLEQAETLGVVLEKMDIQNMAYDILENEIPRYMNLFKTALQNAGQTESESAHQELHRFFQEYQFLRECLKLGQRLNFHIDRYRQVLISSELGVF
ncbi:glycoside hydrolase family 57 [Candidatus Moduliflexus flocculans]|uniref:Glycoside hydrolase family 57 n=1 Tax=Candidatus Moduliflexus flocculans TaxID=1499966 RepID=A0A081BQL6_9BACT|nr:glycoside hydrolase family 57 [Candidatus Moduliflexus flocculans]